MTKQVPCFQLLHPGFQEQEVDKVLGLHTAQVCWRGNRIGSRFPCKYFRHHHHCTGCGALPHPDPSVPCPSRGHLQTCSSSIQHDHRVLHPHQKREYKATCIALSVSCPR